MDPNTPIISFNDMAKLKSNFKDKIKDLPNSNEIYLMLIDSYIEILHP